MQHWRMKKYAIKLHHQNQNSVERIVKLVKNCIVFLIELFNTPKNHLYYTHILIVALCNRTGNATLN